jgi:hypothetical protein
MPRNPRGYDAGYEIGVDVVQHRIAQHGKRELDKL